jgi:anaerobic ribonucleoside-triphosphate reductase
MNLSINSLVTSWNVIKLILTCDMTCSYFQQLYDLGVRKAAIVGLGQIGCIPYELARLNNSTNKNTTCNENINKAISMFNTGVLQIVKRFNIEKPGAKFIYVNTVESSKDLISNAATYGKFIEIRECLCTLFLDVRKHIYV